MSDTEKTEVPATNVVVQGRLSYADIHKPRAFAEGVKARYKTLVLIPKDTEQGKKDFAALQAASKVAKTEKWGEKIPKLQADKLCVKDGDQMEGEETDGCWVLSASEENAPQVLDRDGKTRLVEADGKIYSGANARVLVNLWAQDNKYGKRINANLYAVQFVAHGEAFGKGRVDAESMFGSLDDETVSGFGDMDADDDIPF
jgi:hypothetical protein